MQVICDGNTKKAKFSDLGTWWDGELISQNRNEEERIQVEGRIGILGNELRTCWIWRISMWSLCLHLDILWGFSGSPETQTVKNPPAMWETWVRSLSWEGLLEEGMATHSSILAWRIPMDRGTWRAIQFMGLQRVWRDWVTIGYPCADVN